MKINQVEELPFAKFNFKVINVTITSSRLFHLKSTLVDYFINHKIDVLIFDRATGDMMHWVPFDIYHDNGEIQSFIFVPESNHKIDDWKAILLKRFHWTWIEALEPFILSNKFKELNKKLNVDSRKSFTVHPALTDTYNAFSTSFTDIRVCIIGQSPYPNMIDKDHHVANGWAFSTYDKKTPVTLQKIKEVLLLEQQELPNNLKEWIIQGVLLLNTSLTLIEGKNEPPYEDWQPFLRAVIEVLVRKGDVVFILMGSKAKVLQKFIPKDYFVVSCEHPVAASYEDRRWNSEDVFGRVNAHFIEKNRKPIQWVNFVRE